MIPKFGKGEEKYLNFCLHYLEHSVVDYLLNSLDEVLVSCFDYCYTTDSFEIKPEFSPK